MTDPVTIAPKNTTNMPSGISDSELERLATEELLKEAKTLAKIASVEGALGWKKRRILRTNKIFLQQTIKRTVNSNKRKYNVKTSE